MTWLAERGEGEGNVNGVKEDKARQFLFFLPTVVIEVVTHVLGAGCLLALVSV